ncbi:MAG: TMEM175 family protein [Bacteroidia bacterium]
MTKSRLEAFSDGVLAIIITIMVLELKVPHEVSFEALFELGSVFISYLFSFVFVGIYWGNHHHLLHTVHHVTPKIIWGNMGLLFFLSLIPFTTAWMGENDFQGLTVALYAFDLLLCAVSFYILQTVIMAHHTHSTALITALKTQEKKGMFSLLLYALAVAGAFFYPVLSGIFILITVVIWIIPDKNIERALREEE